MCCFLVNNGFSSPLIFSITKEVKAESFVEIGVIDAVKFRQLRVSIKFAPSAEGDEIQRRYSELIVERVEADLKLSDLKMTLKENHPDIKAKQSELDKINAEISQIEKSRTSPPALEFMAVELGNEMPVEFLDSQNLNKSFIIDSPPTKLKLTAKGRGKYTVYIWGQ